MNDNQAAGGCLCGAVSFIIQLPVERLIHCHCSRCRKATGGAHATNIFVRPEAFEWKQGEKQVARWDLAKAKSFAIAHCTICGCQMPHVTRDGTFMVIPAGSIESEIPKLSRDDIYIKDAPSWSCLTGTFGLDQTA